MLDSSPRTLPAPSTANFYGPLRLQQCPYRHRKSDRHRFALRARQHRHSRPMIALYQTIDLLQLSYHSPPVPRRHRLVLGASCRTRSRPLLAFPSDFSWSPHTTRSLNDPGPIQTIVQPAQLHAFTIPQLRIREPATPHDRESSSRGMIAFRLPPLFFHFCTTLPPLTIVFSSFENVFSFEFSSILLPLLFF